MNEEVLTTINRMRAVTISREYGSGGGEIAARLAKRLGWQLIDHALVERVASELGTSLEEAEAHDESSGGVISQLPNSMRKIYSGYTDTFPPEAFLSREARCWNRGKNIGASASPRRVVVVGRGS